MDLSGFWAGVVVRGSSSAPVFINVSVSGDGAITGTYEMPNSPSEFRTGKFEATLSDESLAVVIPGGDARTRFDLRVVQLEKEQMIFGYAVGSGRPPRLATVTLFKQEPSHRALAGIWPPAPSAQ
ncbi:MAG TPA: hypothetical protein VMH28_09060 [Candidatus Acidoferrales bacterium]|nr:hypothetical protein [Candidatus Acidoferrales bacterium]